MVRIYRENNYIFVRYLDGFTLQGHCKNVFVGVSSADSDKYHIFNIAGGFMLETQGVVIGEIANKDGVLYDKTSWTEFYTTNTGNFSVNGGGSGGGEIITVSEYIDLPTASSHFGEIYAVLTSTGSAFLFNRKEKGLYYSNGSEWLRLGDTPNFFSDTLFEVFNGVDKTKAIKFNISGITSETKRTLSFQDRDGTVALLDDTINGSVFITNIAPQTTGNVGNKVFSSNGRVLDSCASDTQNVVVSVLALPGHTNYRPIVKINNITVPLTDPNTTIPLFSGTLNVTLSSDPLVKLTVIHEDGAQHSTFILQEAPPIIEELRFVGDYPSGQTELKSGDTFQLFVRSNEPIDRVEVSDTEACIANTTTVSVGDTHTITVTIANRGTTTQSLRARVRVRKPSGSWSVFQFTENTVVLNNTFPTINIASITYPIGQQALKGSETATINNTITNYDSVVYSSPNSELSVSNLTLFETNKIVQRVNGSYNVATNNFRITANRVANNATTVVNSVVFIANIAPTITVTIPSSRLRSGGNDGTSPQNYTITINSTQRLLQAPVMVAPRGDWQGGGFSWGATTTSFTRQLQIHDNMLKGVFNFGGLDAINLAGIPQTTITSGATYEIGGFVQRVVPLAAFANETIINTEVVTYNKVTLSWSFEPTVVNRAALDSTPPITNSWCLVEIGYGVNPVTVRILDAKTSASSQESLITIQESI